jgi:hypothetical protein
MGLQRRDHWEEGMISFDDFYSYAPANRCVYLPTMDYWSNEAVDMRLEARPLVDANGNPVRNGKGKVIMLSASEWFAKYKSVECIAWAPGEPTIIRDKLLIDEGWRDKPGATTLNTYLSPAIIPGDPTLATFWLDHWRALYPDYYEYFVAWLAHRVQFPGIKPNFCIMLIGAPGIGKDMLLYPLRFGVGPSNYRDVTLSQLTGSFNDHLQTIVLHINEARDLGEGGHGRIDRYMLYEYMKGLLATPPTTHRINRKYKPEYVVRNVSGTALTTNHPDAMHLIPEDRRFLADASERARVDFTDAYFVDFFDRYENRGGIGHVLAYLRAYDLSKFNPKAPPPQTPAFWVMVNADRSTRDYNELADAIDTLKKPEKEGDPPKKLDALTVPDLQAAAPSAEWLHDRKHWNTIGHRLRRCGYIPVHNPDSERNSGVWRIGGKRMTIYARADLSAEQRLTAAKQLQKARTPAAKSKPNLTIVPNEGEAS